MTEHDRIIGEFKGQWVEFRKWEEKEHEYIRDELKEIKVIVRRHEIKWARIGAYALVAGIIGSGAFQVALAFFK